MENKDIPGALRHTFTPNASAIGDNRTLVREAPREIPVAADVDVLVAGGGPTGIGAALAAASEGARVLLVERHGMLGGLWTAGLLNPLFEYKNGWIVGQLVSRLQQQDAWYTGTFGRFDTETMKYQLETMCEEAGVEFWLYVQATEALVIDNRVCGIIVEGKSGREAILAKVVIDCTGDGDIAARAGVPFQLGRETDGLMQPMTLMFEVRGEGLDLEKKIVTELQASVEAHGLQPLPYGREPRGAGWILNAGDGVADVQATHVYRYDATNTRDISKATVEARKQVHQIFMPALRGCEGWQHLQLTQTAPTMGVRESRHLEGRYRLNSEDVAAGRIFEDAVARCCFHCDIHEIYPNDEGYKAFRIPIQPYEIPYRCLLPKTLEGLLFAGRAISGDHTAHASYRVTGTCMAMGQAAGLAAGMAVSAGVMPHEIDGTELHRALRERGVLFLDDIALTK